MCFKIIFLEEEMAQWLLINKALKGCDEWTVQPFLSSRTKLNVRCIALPCLILIPPRPVFFSAFTHHVCRLFFLFTTSLPQLTCRGFGQQPFSFASLKSPLHFSPPLRLHPWPPLPSFFTLWATSQPSLPAFFIHFGMETWLQLVGKVVWGGRGGHYRQSRSEAPLAVSGQLLLCFSALESVRRKKEVFPTSLDLQI